MTEEKAIKEIITNIGDNFDKKLYAIKTRDELLKTYFHFNFNKKYDCESRRLRDFFDNLENFKHFAKKWESKKFGWVCSTDRVYQNFINPLCKKFEETRSNLKINTEKKLIKYLEGVLLHNGEFICAGKSLGFLNKNQLKFIKEELIK